MKILAIISIAVGLCFGAKTTQKSLNECLNELNDILYSGYLQNFELRLAEFEQYMNRLKSGLDKLKKARAKDKELEQKSKECEKLKQ